MNKQSRGGRLADGIAYTVAVRRTQNAQGQNAKKIVLVLLVLLVLQNWTDRRPSTCGPGEEVVPWELTVTIRHAKYENAREPHRKTLEKKTRTTKSHSPP